MVKKRTAEASSKPVKDGQREDVQGADAGHDPDIVDDEMGEFEDAWAEASESSEGEYLEEGDQDNDEDMEETDKGIEEDAEQTQTYIPGVSKLGKDEVLVADQAAYILLQSLNMQWPCLSFDIIQDNLGNERRSFPMSAMVVAGSQADQPSKNEITVIKISSLHRTQRAAEDSESSDDEEDEGNPIIESRSIPANGGINRLRYTSRTSKVASWHETGKVQIWDVARHIQSLNVMGHVIPQEANKPEHTISVHKDEGYALAWSPHKDNILLSGDNTGRIHLTTFSGSWTTEPEPFTSHQGSVEDIVFSPSEPNVFASCGSDGTVRVWNMASKNRKKSAITISAHPGTDVNVLSWNQKVSYLLATGADDGRWSVWDLRSWKSGADATPVASFDWHKAPITSIEWHPQEESVLAVSSADDQVTLWDLSVELDAEEQAAKENEGLGNVPSQLMFVHMGQKDVKEVHWHPQIPSLALSTAATGMNIFKSISV